MVAEKAERLFSLERELERGLLDYKEGRAGRLRLVSTFLPAHYLLPQALARFKTLYPQVKASLQTLNSRKAAESLLRYEADAALIGGAGSWEADGLTGESLLDDEWWFIVPEHHRLAGKRTGLAEMLEEDFVMREAGSSGREMLLAVGRMYGTKAPKAGLEVNGPGKRSGRSRRATEPISSRRWRRRDR
ncbi:LysR substrate-binding domain-containing protein [Paenibacillus sp. CC-CFT747]|nr:LysR substrate-binding domain-containing protein [Paenibacillus sp. CC-CFT747]